MQYRSFRCSCGYVCVTPEGKPICPDCGKALTLVTDEAEKKEVDTIIRPVLHQIATGKKGGS
jgi:uncharacterized Zn finger protein (UPF0148 family)